MYADRYQRPGARSGSLAAAATITGTMILGLMSSVPEMLPISRPNPTIVEAIPLPPVPPPRPERRTQPRPAATPTAALPDATVPDLPPLPTDNPLTGTTGPGPVLADPLPPPGNGGATAIEPPTAPVMGAVTPDPRYARDFQPAYPPAKERAGEEARITVRVLVGTDGRVRAVEPVGSPDAAFFASTRRQALARWRFRPATRDGVPYEAWHTMSVRFQLTE